MRAVFIAGLAAVLVAGCSGHKQTYVTQQGTTTVETNNNNQTVTVNSKEGTSTYGKGAVDPAKLGIPVYPGATTTEGGISGKTAQGAGEIVALSTKDPFDKVYAWYQQHMPAGSEGMHMSNAGSSVATFKIGKENDKEQRSVMISSEKDKTSILLSHSVKP